MSPESETITALKIDVLRLGKEVDRLKRDGSIVHIFANQRYRLVIERAASTKGVDGFKVEVNGDDFDDVQNQIGALYSYAKQLTDGKEALTNPKE